MTTSDCAATGAERRSGSPAQSIRGSSEMRFEDRHDSEPPAEIGETYDPGRDLGSARASASLRLNELGLADRSKFFRPVLQVTRRVPFGVHGALHGKAQGRGDGTHRHPRACDERNAFCGNASPADEFVVFDRVGLVGRSAGRRARDVTFPRVRASDRS